MKAYTDNKTIERNAVILLALGLLEIAAAVLLHTLVKADEVDIGVAALLITGILVLCTSLWAYQRRRKEPVFEIRQGCVAIGERIIPAEQIQHVQIFASLGSIKPIKPEYADIDYWANQPPLAHLSGSVRVTTLEKIYSFLNVLDVMELYAELRKLTADIEATYTLGNRVRPYAYEGEGA